MSGTRHGVPRGPARAPGGGSARPRLLYVVTEDWYFLSHRLPMARAAREAGFDVVVVARDSGRGEEIERAGFHFAPLRLARRGRTPWGEAQAIRDLARLYRLLRPTIVHHVALKPVLYGSVAAAATRVPHVVNALTGLGYVFTSPSLNARVLGALLKPALRWALRRRGTRVILQNRDDLTLLERLGLVDPRRATLIRGSGVDTDFFRPEKRVAPEKRAANEDDALKSVRVVMVARALRDKGVLEFIRAAEILARDGLQPAVEMVFVGEPDPANPASVTEAELRHWAGSGTFRYLGSRDDMDRVLAEADIAVLPSYREGLPKTLLEAAAMALPLIATDVPGCREIVRPNETGLLVPAGDAPALADAIRELASDPSRRRRLGDNARQLVTREFSDDVVGEQTARLYRQLLETAAQ